MNPRKKLIAGNWKMNKTSADAVALVQEIVTEVGRQTDVDVVVCPPFTALESAGKKLEGSTVKLGAQNMHPEASGAYTGEISAGMLRALFTTYVILGHSERRTYFHETDHFINQKVLVALKNQLKPILCVGETLAEREAGQTEAVVKRQLSAVIHQLAHCAAEMVVAYEPVWAIGTGRTATPEQAQAVHAVLRAQLQAATGRGASMKILYGGSVKADNAATLFAMPDIDGGLIGGASLKAADFVAICRAAH